MRRLGPSHFLQTPNGMPGDGTAAKPHIIRHAVASVLLLALLVPMGAVALMQGHAASKAIALSDQENFSSFRTASSEAGR